MIVVHETLLASLHLRSHPFLLKSVLAVSSLHFVKTSIVCTLLALSDEPMAKFGLLLKESYFDGVDFEVVVEIDESLVIHVDFIDAFYFHDYYYAYLCTE